MLGFLIVGEIGRMRPKFATPPPVKGIKEAGLGEFGYAPITAQAAGFAGAGFSEPLAVKQSLALTDAVSRFLPSKFSESSAMFRYAISVTTAPDRRTTDLPWLPKRACKGPLWKFGLQAIPRRGCQLLLSWPQTGIRPLL